MSESTPSGPPSQEPTPPSFEPPAAQPPAAPPPAGSGYGSVPPAGSGYGSVPPPPGAAPVGYANNDEKTWALIAHFGGIVAGFIAPLVAMLVKGNESATVRAHSVEALNFQITATIAYLVSIVLTACSFGILFFLPLLVWIAVIVFCVIAGMKANEGQLYRYPATIRLVK